jgi:hypothetical protein
MQSLNENAPAWTAAMVKARLVEAFEIDRRLPNPGHRLAATEADHSDGRSTLSFTRDDGPKDDYDPAPLADSSSLDEQVSEDENVPDGLKPDFINRFGGGFGLFKRGTKRAEQARVSAERDELERLLSAARKRAKLDVAYWAELCRDGEALIRRNDHKRNEHNRWAEALGWAGNLVEVEKDESVKDARAIVLMWLRSGQSEAEFCQSNCPEPNELRRWIERYCKAIASRLQPSPPRVINPFAQGRHPDHLVFGIENIAGVLGRTPKKTERLVADGKLPAATFLGHLCAHRDMLRPYRNRAAVALKENEVGRLAALTKEAEDFAARRLALHEFAEYRIDRTELLKRIALAAPIGARPTLTVIEGGLRNISNTRPHSGVKLAA